MDRRTHLCFLLAGAAMLAGLSGCTAQANPVTQAPSPTPAATLPITPPAPTPAPPTAGCPVTRPDPRTRGPDIGNYVRDGLWTHLPPEGIVSAGGVMIRPDGTIGTKWPWWREGQAQGRLTISGQRLDAPAPLLQAGTPDGYGDSGFQVSTLTFPDEGCWEVTGQAGEARLTFVILVRRGADR